MQSGIGKVNSKNLNGRFWDGAQKVVGFLGVLWVLGIMKSESLGVVVQEAFSAPSARFYNVLTAVIATIAEQMKYGLKS